jgi:mannan endo-1,4-beta-mannosidase
MQRVLLHVRKPIGARRLVALPVTFLAAGLLALGCSSSSGPSPSAHAKSHPTSTVPTSPPTVAPTTEPEPNSSRAQAGGQPLPVPGTGAYVGAWVNPSPGHSEFSQLPVFVASVGKTPAILSLYTSWTTPAPIGHMQRIVDEGSIPLISWGCTSTAAVNAGSDDQLITAYATRLRSFAHPVLLRWFWEMNLSVPKDVNCIGSGGPAGFVSAWIRIWDIFHQVGATNVSFVWNPGVTGGLTRMAPFFPGASYVDWIGADGYDRNSPGTDAFSQVFGPWYAAYAGYGKPMMIGETAAMATDQVAYLQDIASVLPAQFPLVKALVYFDAEGPAASWILTPAGLQAYRQLAGNPYFSP